MEYNAKDNMMWHEHDDINLVMDSNSVTQLILCVSYCKELLESGISVKELYTDTASNNSECIQAHAALIRKLQGALEKERERQRSYQECARQSKSRREKTVNYLFWD